VSLHKSVLLAEVIAAFEDLKMACFVDGTLGAGGHSEAILQNHPEIQQLIGIDQDTSALDIARARLEPYHSKVRFVHGNFSNLDKYQIPPIDGFLADLGVSSMQLDRPERGFSFMREGPLDMRMDATGVLTAADIVNTWSESELGRIFRIYGEEKQWRRAAGLIVEEREKGPFQTTTQLADLFREKLHKGAKKGIHPATLIFQALRIVVNGELDVIEKVLPAVLKLMKPGGRIAIITFHSLEDRIIKNTFRYWAEDKESSSGVGGIFIDKVPEGKLVNRKPIEASEEEITENPRSRSAKLRVFEKR
jgi:16S rRNA (cytosine1402-N4)-methyltransferase